ncbi:hypothetical protein BDV41DRAFT_55401 [Aspergillus transmontanensis]|uniref:Uncharacterized protein n=1 Tax=Aspergillus transmontanensis TaxID=1034304 RepID=A0A5N6VG83_9EURO|nr:hypothetical protein BDV41DRAFT_55401 [Aspergillus transmontanensis]
MSQSRRSQWNQLTRYICLVVAQLLSMWVQACLTRGRATPRLKEPLQHDRRDIRGSYMTTFRGKKPLFLPSSVRDKLVE